MIEHFKEIIVPKLWEVTEDCCSGGCDIEAVKLRFDNAVKKEVSKDVLMELKKMIDLMI